MVRVCSRHRVRMRACATRRCPGCGQPEHRSRRRRARDAAVRDERNGHADRQQPGRRTLRLQPQLPRGASIWRLLRGKKQPARLRRDRRGTQSNRERAEHKRNHADLEQCLRPLTGLARQPELQGRAFDEHPCGRVHIHSQRGRVHRVRSSFPAEIHGGRPTQRPGSGVVHGQRHRQRVHEAHGD